MIIRTLSDFRRVIRSGPYAWPGGYDVIFATSDGGTLCHACAEQHRREIADAIASVNVRGGWHVSGVFLSCDTDGPVHCDHCAREIVEELID